MDFDTLPVLNKAYTSNAVYPTQIHIVAARSSVNEMLFRSTAQIPMQTMIRNPWKASARIDFRLQCIHQPGHRTCSIDSDCCTYRTGCILDEPVSQIKYSRNYLPCVGKKSG
ncbi:MAG: hypothetical protein IKF90_15985 [Parasporobacterium sp.]|nr:hypothetical protein [Parasporobacterium sp.]